jgi:hypothetical protein
VDPAEEQLLSESLHCSSPHQLWRPSSGQVVIIPAAANASSMRHASAASPLGARSQPKARRLAPMSGSA